MKQIVLCLTLILVLTACSTSKSLTFQMENGEQLQVTLKTGDGYDLSANTGSSLRLYVQKDDETVLEGILLPADTYAEYVQGIRTAEEVEVLTAEPEDAPVSFIYQWEAEDGTTRTDFLFQIEGIAYAGLFESSASYEDADAAFQRLSLEAAS